MLRSISLRKELLKAKAEEVISYSKSSNRESNATVPPPAQSIANPFAPAEASTAGNYKYIVSIFYQQADSLSFLISQLFS